MLRQLKINKLLKLLVLNNSLEETEMISHYLNELVLGGQESESAIIPNHVNNSNHTPAIENKSPAVKPVSDIDSMVAQLLNNNHERKILSIKDNKHEQSMNKEHQVNVVSEKPAQVNKPEPIKSKDNSDKNTVIAIVSEITGNSINDIDCDLSLKEYYGLDSLAEIEFLNLIGERLNVQVEFGFMVEHTTINQILEGLSKVAA